MSFDPKRHTIKVQGGREYLPVSARLVWFRSEHPDWGIVTSPVEINLHPEGNRPPYAIFSATIFNAEGKVMATATKMEDQRGFGDFLEKAETGAVGRALAYVGFGTQFAPELEEGGRYADSPYAAGMGPGGGNNRFASGGGPNRGPAGNGFGSGPNGANRPVPPGAAPLPQQRAAPAPRPMAPPADENPFDDEPAAASAPPPSAPAPRPAGAAQANGTGITRVREPERGDFDPGGPEEDDEDPFAEEGEAPAAPRASAAPPQRPTAKPPASAGSSDLSGNRCTVDGCPNVLTPSQMTMSMNKFGRALCLLHQRDAAPATASNGAARRPAAKAAAGDTLL